MKQKQRVALLCMAAAALIFAACDGDSGNNSTEPQGNSSSSTGIYSSGEQVNSSPVVNSSSSSIVVSSSSAKALSSSSSIKQGTLIYGGRTYKTVTIGTQTWMAENLNYADSTAMPNLKGNSWCYENSADSCAKYGRLYTWTGAMNIDSSYQSASAAAVISAPWRGACPTGWHIPTDAEWTTLETVVGSYSYSVAGTKLKSTSGWNDDGDESGNGTDAYGFSALPAGARYDDGNFSYVGDDADFWSATEDGTGIAYYRYLYHFYAIMHTYYHNKKDAFSVRCVQD
jgi:uncharacterized protein (TIGR02145 family)